MVRFFNSKKLKSTGLSKELKPVKADKRRKKSEKAIRKLKMEAKKHSKDRKKKKREESSTSSEDDNYYDESDTSSDSEDDLESTEDTSSFDDDYDIDREVEKCDVKENKKQKMNEKLKVDIIKRDYVDICSQIHSVAKSITCSKEDKSKISTLVYYYIKYFLYSCCIKKKPVFDWLEEFKDRINIY